MTLPFGPECLIHTGKLRIALHRHPGHVIERMPQAAIASAPHDHLAALPTLPRHWRHPTLGAYQMIVPFHQGLCGFGKEPGGSAAR